MTNFNPRPTFDSSIQIIYELTFEFRFEKEGIMSYIEYHQNKTSTNKSALPIPCLSHSQMEHYFFSYLLTFEVYLIKVLEIMAQILQYITFLSLKAIKMSPDFILNYLKKVVGGATTQKYQKQMLKP